MATGIRKLHSRGCQSRKGGRCNCGAGYEAYVYLAREGKKSARPSPVRPRRGPGEPMHALQRIEGRSVPYPATAGRLPLP
jgi:hypothetical protein